MKVITVLAALLFAGASGVSESDLLGSFEKSLSLSGSSVNASSIPTTALLKVRKKKSSTLDHFNDKIDEVCIELAKEVQNATKCLAPAAYDLRVKSMSFQRVLEYYQYEIETFRVNWRSVLKKFTDSAQTYIENPLASSLIQERMMFGNRTDSFLQTQTNASALRNDPDPSPGPDPAAVIKEFRTVYDVNAKVVPDHRDYDVGPNKDQTLGYEIDENEQPLDRLRIDGMRPFPTAAGWNETGTTASIYRQKYGEEYNPVPPGQEAPEYILDRKGGDIFNIEDYAQRFIFWRNEHIAAFNNFIFATGPYQAAALAYSTVLKELANQVEQIKATTLLTFRGYYEGEQNKKIENAIRLYQQRSFQKAGDIIPDEIKAFQTSPLQHCGNCEVRYGDAFKNRLSPDGVCLPNVLFPCGPQPRTDGTIALNPYYLWNDQSELWKARFQQMDSISTYMWNQRKVSLLEKSGGKASDQKIPFESVYAAMATAVHKTQVLLGSKMDPSAAADDNNADTYDNTDSPAQTGVFSQATTRDGIAVVHEKVNAAGKAQERMEQEDEYERLVKLGSGNNPKGIADNLKPEEQTTGNQHLNNFVNKGRDEVHAQNAAQYLSDNDMTNRWDAVSEAESQIVHNKYGYPHPVIQSEPKTMSQFKAVATEELNKEMQYQEILQQGRWEKLYNDAMDKLIKDYGYSLDFLREESFKIAYETSRRKFDHCSSTLKKRIPSFMGVDAAAMAAEAKADEEEKATDPIYREYVKDLLDRYANAQEGTAVVCHEAMMCVEAGRYELELAANAYRLVLEQMSADVADTALRWSDAVKDLGTAWAGNAFSTLLSTKALPTSMMQRAKGVNPAKLMSVNKHHIQSEIKKSMALKQKMLTPNELYEDINIKFNPRDFVMEYRVVFWKTRQAFVNVYRHFVYTMGPYQAATDAYLASMKEFSSEIDHKIGTFLGKDNSAIVDGTWTHENTYNMYWSSFRNGVGLLRTAKHIVAQAGKQNLYIQQFLLRAWHMRLDTGKMEIAGCDPAHYAKPFEIDGHKYEDSRPEGQGHAQQEGNRLGRGTHPCFLGQYTNNNGYVESLPAITWLANEYDQAFGNDEMHGDASKCKKTKKILAKYRCNGGANHDEIEAPEQYPGTEGIPGAIRFDNLKCTTGHLLVDQALYKFTYQIWLSHVEHTEATTFVEWLNYDKDKSKPEPKDYEACTSFLHQYSYTKFEKGCVSDKSPILKTLLGQTVEACQAECDDNEDCRTFEYGVDYDGENHQPGDCQLRSSIDYFQCDGEKVNLDAYMKKVTSCQAFGQGQVVETAKKPYKIDGAVTLAKSKTATVSKKKKKHSKHHKRGKHKKTSKHRAKALKGGFSSYIELREEALHRNQALKQMQTSGSLKQKAPAGFKAYMYCESDDDCDHAPGSETLPRLKCESPNFSMEHTVYNTKTGHNEKVPEAARKFCVGPGKEGDHCNQFLCSFGMSCTKTAGGKCARDSYKYHDWWTYDDGRTTHASSNTFGLEYRKARDYFLSCNANIQRALIGFVDAWAAANQLSHRMEERICGGQVKEQEGTGTELGMLQQKQ